MPRRYREKYDKADAGAITGTAAENNATKAVGKQGQIILLIVALIAHGGERRWQ